MAAAPPSFQPGTRFGAFMLIREIAHGGMGYVYEASEVALGRRVALKLIRNDLKDKDDFVKRFQREARTLGRLVHPNVVSVHSMGEHEGVHYIAMDYVEGLNLREFLAAGEFFLGDLLEILRRTAAGLAAIHANGIVHRDIKLSNILVDKNREPRIADFGLAKPQGQPASDITDTGQLIGTIQYMAPELLASQPFTEKSDIFALGLLFFEALVGYNPFLAETTVQTADRVRNVEVVIPSEVQAQLSAELRALILGMVAKKELARVATMAEVCAQLDAAIRAMPASGQRWPAGFSVENMTGTIDLMIDRGCSSPTEVSLVLAKAREKAGGTASLHCDAALIDASLESVRGQGFKLPTDISGVDAAEIALAAVPAATIPKAPPPKAKKKFVPEPESDVALDEKILQTERRKDAIAEAKHTAPKQPIKPVELAKAPPIPQPRPAPEPVYRPQRQGPSLGKIFSFKRIVLVGLAAAGGYIWFVGGQGDAVVAGPPECKGSAEGFEGAPPYKDVAFPASFAPYLELGIVCDPQMLCWARSRPWVSFQANRDLLFPKSPWGESYMSASLVMFQDQAKKTLRVRNTEAGLQTRLQLGLEECIFSLRHEKVPLLRYHLAMLVGSLVGDLLGGSEPPPPAPTAAAPATPPPAAQGGKSAVAPPIPEKKDEPWNQRGWNRFLNYINNGK